MHVCNRTDSVPDNVYSANSFKLRGDTEESFPVNTPKMSTSSGPDHAHLQPRPKHWRLSQYEYLLVVRTLLDSPLCPISIPVAVGPYQKWTKGTLIFMFKETVEVVLPSLARNVETREESRYNLSSNMRLVLCFLTSALLEVY